ncbi:MAG TPA: hypothetical protein VF660_07200 [Actinomycetota bacterium]|jgi:uncharacterized protein with GYD domain
MLHMVVNTHNPESCAFRGEEEERLLRGPIDQMRDSAGQNGLTFTGWWVNRASHEIFMLIDAPSAHVIEEALLSAGMIGRTHSRILPVIPVDLAEDQAARRARETAQSQK